MSVLIAGKRPQIEPLGLPVAEVAAYGGPSRAELFRLIAEGKIRSYKVGRRRMVFLADIRQLIEDAAAN